MNIYLVDFENTGEAGLAGAGALKAEDAVYIFYNENIKSLSFPRCVELVKATAKIDFIETKKVGKNYLDFQLSTFLGYMVGDRKNAAFYIISGDTGYTSVIDFWKGKGVNIAQQKSIAARARKEKQTSAAAEQATQQTKQAPRQTTKQKGLPNAYRNKVKKAVKEEKLHPGKYTPLYNAIANSKSKPELNNSIVKQFGSTQGGQIYGKVKDIFEEYLKETAEPQA